MFGFLRRLLGLGPPGARPARADLSAARLAEMVGVPLSDLRGLKPEYHVYQVPKRTGGTRTILAPGAKLKHVQRRILRRVLGRLGTHPAAMGFEHGESIVSNARPHVGWDVVIKLDLQDFFTSTSAVRVRDYFVAIGWQREAAELLTRLVTHDGSLPQGAPTSPRLSNLLNVRLDSRLEGLAQTRGMNYTRYADDITFSGKSEEVVKTKRPNPRVIQEEQPDPARTSRVNDVIHATKIIVRDEGYRIHEHKKLRIARRGDRQIVTGLVVNDKVNLPRAKRRWLRAVEHHLATGRTASLTQQQLDGWHALMHMIEEQAEGE
jgi:retron-type reverse transcriptase